MRQLLNHFPCVCMMRIHPWVWACGTVLVRRSENNCGCQSSLILSEIGSPCCLPLHIPRISDPRAPVSTFTIDALGLQVGSHTHLCLDSYPCPHACTEPNLTFVMMLWMSMLLFSCQYGCCRAGRSVFTASLCTCLLWKEKRGVTNEHGIAPRKAATSLQCKDLWLLARNSLSLNIEESASGCNSTSIGWLCLDARW